MGGCVQGVCGVGMLCTLYTIPHTPLVCTLRNTLSTHPLYIRILPHTTLYTPSIALFINPTPCHTHTPLHTHLPIAIWSLHVHIHPLHTLPYHTHLIYTQIFLSHSCHSTQCNAQHPLYYTPHTPTLFTHLL